MKTVLAVSIAAALLLLPGLASAGANGCNGLNNQIAHYTKLYARADQLGNPMWEKRLGSHLEGLLAQRAAICPEYDQSDGTMEALKGLIKFAAKAAVTYFTMGAF
jgi:hypothetical protein